MIKELNRQLRKAILITGAIVVLVNMLENEDKGDDDEQIYQSEEFDDIW